MTPDRPSLEIHERFPRYLRHDPLVPVWDLTPSLRGCFHRFFDTWPISPSGRYLAVLRMPQEVRPNQPGESADVVLVDLHAGTDRVVAQTFGWEQQLGANLNWGVDDHSLVFNDVDVKTWQPMLVRLDPLTGKSEQVPGGVYHVSPDGRYAAAASTERMVRTQRGYGVLLSPERVPINIGAPEDDGLFIIDLPTGVRRLVLPLSRAIEYCPELRGQRLDDWNIYGFHSKWSPDGQRLIFTIRRFLRSKAYAWDNIGNPAIRFDVLTCKPDGSDVHNAVPSEYWLKGGHHINWYPDSRQLSMNLGYFGSGLTLTRVGYDGSDLRPIVTTPCGSGHPSVHPCGRILADTYCGEKPMAFDDNSVPLRWIDPANGTEQTLVRIASKVESGWTDSALRVDAHPAWDPTWRYVAFNGVINNTRHVLLADLSTVID
jgi:WD40-like Beta Propeller Repeat